MLLWRRIMRRRIPIRPLDDLVEFTAIEPYAGSLRIIIDLDSLTFAHDKLIILADRAIHPKAPGQS